MSADSVAARGDAKVYVSTARAFSLSRDTTGPDRNRAEQA